MLKIGEFSKLAKITIKALRFYEKEGLLIPAKVDQNSNYRFYETSQLETASKIKSLRQLDFSIDEIKAYLQGKPIDEILQEKELELKEKQKNITFQLSIIHYLKEDHQMKYQAVIKEINETNIYYEERRLHNYSDITNLVLESAQECLTLNPKIECLQPDYCFCEYLDEKYKEKDILVRYSQAVKEKGNGNERIKFKTLPKTKVLSIYHKGAYEQLGDAYSYIMNYAQKNGYQINGLARECYIDGIWNKENEEEWLTEIQLPIL
ncbi:MAG: GyrI-like domain-containing protein [Traorella sp.]